MRHKKLKFGALLVLGLGLSGLQAQNSVLPSGGTASGSGGSASYSLGQLVYTTNTGENGSIAHGVQQPYEISVVLGIEEGKGIRLDLSVYPNPTEDILYLSVDSDDTINIESLNFLLHDINGKTIVKKKLESDKTRVDMTKLQPATYFLQVMKNSREIKTFKIIKN